MTRLYTLIRDESQATVEASFTTVAIINTILPCGNYPVALAVRFTKQAALEYFNGLGADLDVISENGYSAMHWAVVNNDITALNYLIANGADIDIKQTKFKSTFSSENTALHMASVRGFDSLAQVLVDAGASKVLTNVNGSTAADLSSDADMDAILA